MKNEKRWRCIAKELSKTFLIAEHFEFHYVGAWNGAFPVGFIAFVEGVSKVKFT